MNSTITWMSKRSLLGTMVAWLSTIGLSSKSSGMNQSYSTLDGDKIIMHRHWIANEIFEASNLEINYYGGRFGAPDQNWEHRVKSQQDWDRDSYGGAGTYKAFDKPFLVKWRSKDRKDLSYELDLSKIFSNNAFKHGQDPKKVFHKLPLDGAGATILIEVDNRTLRVFLIADILLVDDDPTITHLRRAPIKNLAFSVTL